MEWGAQEVILDLDPGIPIDQQSWSKLYLTPAVFGFATKSRLPGQHSLRLLLGLTTSPKKTYDSIPRRKTRGAEIEHDSLRTSLMAMEKMRSSVGEILVRVHKLGKESRIEGDAPTFRSPFLHLSYMSRPSPRALEPFDCCCLQFWLKIVPQK